MTTEKRVSILVHTPFRLNLPGKPVMEFGKGRHNVPAALASHWFVLAHAEPAESIVNEGDGQQAFIDSLHTQIAEKDAFIDDLKAALVELKAQNDSLQTQLTAAQAGGNGAKDAKEPKPANGK